MITQPGNEINVTHTTQASVVEKTSPINKVLAKQSPTKKGTSGQQVLSSVDNAGKKAVDKKLTRIVQDINQNKQLIQRELRFSVDKDSGKTVVKVMDMATKKVVRQIPTEETLRVAKMLKDGAELKLFNSYT